VVKGISSLRRAVWAQRTTSDRIPDAEGCIFIFAVEFCHWLSMLCLNSGRLWYQSLFHVGAKPFQFLVIMATGFDFDGVTVLGTIFVDFATH
jgi:hypothetical protein